MGKRRYIGLLALAIAAGSVSANAAVVIIDDFESGEGRFTGATNASGTSTGFVAANSSLTHDLTTGQSSLGSQKLTIDDDIAVNVTTTFNWRVRNLSGGGTPANNVTLDSTGFVGYWVKTTTPGLQASIVIDDGAQTERGTYKSIIADGEWHAYEWDLDAAMASTDWFNFASGNGLIDQAQVTIDATYILAPMVGGVAADIDAVVNLDNVSHNPTGSIVPEPASLGLIALGALALGRRRK